MDLSNNLIQEGGQLSSAPGDPPVPYALRLTPYSLQSSAIGLSLARQMTMYTDYAIAILPTGLHMNVYLYYAYKKMSKEVINRPLGLMFQRGKIIATCALNADPADETTIQYIKIIGDENNDGMYEVYTGPLPSSCVQPRSRLIDTRILLTTNTPTCVTGSGLEPLPAPQPQPTPQPTPQ
jgi:hypothetical protein